MSLALASATAVTFVWLGMVLGISFLETPLKFRAPDVTVRIGLGIGRLVFRALNTVEVFLAAALIITTVLGHPAGRIATSAGCVIVLLAVQVAVVRPRLNRRSDRILAGGEAPRSHAHHAYVVLETAKLISLAVTGVLILVS